MKWEMRKLYLLTLQNWKFREIYKHIKIIMRKPSEIKDAKFGGSEGESIVNINDLLCKMDEIGTM